MDVKRLIRDPARVLACLKELPDDRLVCTKPVKLYIPASFAEHNLAEIGSEIYIVGIYALVVEDTYFASSMVNAMMRIEPTSMLRITIEGDEYFEFKFDAGATVITKLHLVQNESLVYRIYDEIISKGRVPWYLGYLQLGKLFDTAGKHGGTKIGSNQEVTELLASVIARDAGDRHKYYRTTVKSLDDITRRPPAFIPLRSVQYAATNTLNKLAGSYFSEAVVSALVSPADRTERIEALLRR